MKLRDIRPNKWYLVDLEWWRDGMGSRVGKCLGHSKILSFGHDCSIEFIDEVYPNGHRGGENDSGITGKPGHCLYVNSDNVIRELSDDEAMAWLI